MRHNVFSVVILLIRLIRTMFASISFIIRTRLFVCVEMLIKHVFVLRLEVTLETTEVVFFNSVKLSFQRTFTMEEDVLFKIIRSMCSI